MRRNLLPSETVKDHADHQGNLSLSLSFNTEVICWKSFRAGHATHLAARGCHIKNIMERGEKESRAVFDYIDADKIDHALFFHTTMERSDEKDKAEKKGTQVKRQNLVFARQ